MKWVGHKDLNLNKYIRNNYKWYVLEVNLEYLKELCDLQNDYPLTRDKLEIKKEMLSSYQ